MVGIERCWGGLVWVSFNYTRLLTEVPGIAQINLQTLKVWPNLVHWIWFVHFDDTPKD